MENPDRCDTDGVKTTWSEACGFTGPTSATSPTLNLPVNIDHNLFFALTLELQQVKLEGGGGQRGVNQTDRGSSCSNTTGGGGLINGAHGSERLHQRSTCCGPRQQIETLS